MRETLQSLAAGDLSVEAAMSELAGYATVEAGRFDATRERRAGVPEAVLGDGKTAEETATLVTTAVGTTGRAIATRINDETVATVTDRLAHDHPDASVDRDERARTLVVHGPGYEAPDLQASIGVVSAGTSDAAVAGEAGIIASEMGATVDQVQDVGVASIERLLDQLDRLRNRDVLVVAAGREGALPTVVAGLVDSPVIGLPVSIGYGHAGEGEAALAGMLQSCTVLSVVNIDDGFSAGAQAGLIARRIDRERD